MAFTYTKRKDGRLMKRVSVNGNLITLYSDSPKDLERQYIEKKSQDHKGIFINDEGMTVGTWADKWVELYKSDKEKATVKMYKDSIRLHIKPYIGNIPLKRLKQSDIAYMLNELTKKNITRKKDVALLTINQILNTAVENDFIYKNVAQGIKIKKHKATEKKPLNDKTISIIKELSKSDNNAFMILFLIYTGLRREELVPLQYKDINLEEKHIVINKAVHFEKNQPIIKDTKNTESRNVPIFNVIYDKLKEMKLSHKNNEYVFPNTLGKMMSETVLKRKVSYVLKDINKKIKSDTLNLGVSNDEDEVHFSPHILRHTYACILHKAKIDLKQAQAWVGDKDIRVLLNIYTHLDAQDNQSSVDKVNAFLS